MNPSMRSLAGVHLTATNAMRTVSTWPAVEAIWLRCIDMGTRPAWSVGVDVRYDGTEFSWTHYAVGRTPIAAVRAAARIVLDERAKRTS